MRKLLFFIIWIVLWAGCVLSYSCNPSRKIEKAKSVFSANKQQAAEWCAKEFPPLTSTEYLPGDTIRDTIYTPSVEYAVVDCPPSDTGVQVKVKIEYRDKVIRTHKTDTVRETKESGPVIYALKGQLEASQANIKEQDKEVKKWKEKAKTRSRNQFVLLGVILVMGAWLTRKLWMPVISRI